MGLGSESTARRSRSSDQAQNDEAERRRYQHGSQSSRHLGCAHGLQDALGFECGTQQTGVRGQGAPLGVSLIGLFPVGVVVHLGGDEPGTIGLTVQNPE